MTPPTLTLSGDDAPTIDARAALLTLRYADLATYARRCSADDAAVRALASHTVVDAIAEQHPAYGAPYDSGPTVVVYTLRPRAPTTESPKPRR